LPLTQFSSESEYLEGVKEGERPDIEIIDTLKEDHSSLEDDLAIMDSLVSVMTRCWQQNPDARPNMIVIRDKLSDLLNQQSPQAIQRSVAAALENMELFLPSERSQNTISLRQFNPITGTFNKSKNEKPIGQNICCLWLCCKHLPSVSPNNKTQLQVVARYIQWSLIKLFFEKKQLALKRKKFHFLKTIFTLSEPKSTIWWCF